MKRLTRTLMALAGILAYAAAASAQSTRVAGQVFDRDGKPWAGVTVTIKSDTGRTFTLKTDQDGKFQQIGFAAGMYTFVLTEATTNLNYSEQHQLFSDKENDITIDFKKLIESGKAAPNQEQQKAQEEQKNKFKEMQTHFNAGRAAMDDYDATKKSMAAAPADQKQALQDKMDTDAKTAVSEMTLAEQGVQAKDVKNHAVVWANLAQAYEKANQLQEAVDAYQKAIDLQPAAPTTTPLLQNQSTALVNLAFASTDPKETADKLAAANADCTKAAGIDAASPAVKACWKNIGVILSNKSDLKDAIEPLQKATQADPKDAQAWFLLGSAYTGTIDSKQEGDKMTYIIPPGTSDAYQKCIDADPNGPYAAQCKTMLDSLATMSGGDATAVGVRPKKKKS